jgi:hypothetical protein
MMLWLHKYKELYTWPKESRLFYFLFFRIAAGQTRRIRGYTREAAIRPNSSHFHQTPPRQFLAESSICVYFTWILTALGSSAKSKFGPGPHLLVTDVRQPIVTDRRILTLSVLSGEFATLVQRTVGSHVRRKIRDQLRFFSLRRVVANVKCH